MGRQPPRHDTSGTRSPYEASLLQNPIADAEHPLEVLRIHSFDHCMACAVQTFDLNGNTPHGGGGRHRPRLQGRGLHPRPDRPLRNRGRAASQRVEIVGVDGRRQPPWMAKQIGVDVAIEALATQRDVRKRRLYAAANHFKNKQILN